MPANHETALFAALFGSAQFAVLDDAICVAVMAVLIMLASAGMFRRLGFQVSLRQSISSDSLLPGDYSWERLGKSCPRRSRGTSDELARTEDSSACGGRALTSTTIDVVVPVFGKWEVTRACLLHLQRQTIPHRVILVDDASPDDTLAKVNLEFPSVDVVEMAVNSGFARACNSGIAQGSGDIVVLVNNDVLADEHMLEHLVRAFDRDSSAGSGVALLTAPDGAVDSFGICADVTLAGFVRFHGADVDSVSSITPTLLGPYGAVAAYRRRALADVGTFDESIFMYGEELDLALRLRESGWGAIAVPESRGVHVGGATTGKGSAKQRYLAGYGRGYLLNVYGVISSRHGLRALTTELLVCGVRVLISRDTASARGRLAGWKAGRGRQRKVRPAEGIDAGISFRTALNMRKSGYWKSQETRFRTG